MDQRSRIVNDLMKLAAQCGKPMSESEAIARVNDKFYNELFSNLIHDTDLDDRKINEMVAELFGSE